MSRSLHTLGLLLSLLAFNAQASGYTDSGNEPLIDARNQLSKALKAQDREGASAALASVEMQIRFLENLSGQDLLPPMQQAVAALSPGSVADHMNRIYTIEIERRLALAEEEMAHYQSARMLVCQRRFKTDPLCCLSTD